MTDAEVFNEIVEQRINKIRSILTSKAKEYATGTNRFHNFDKAALVLGRVASEVSGSPEKALWSFATKHLISIIDIIYQEEWKNTMTEEQRAKYLAMVEEKIGDMINYLILLEGLIKRDTGGVDVRL